MEFPQLIDSEQLNCKCCGESGIDKDFYVQLSAIFSILSPYKIQECFRCPNNELELGRNKPSPFGEGKAILLEVPKGHTKALVQLAYAMGLKCKKYSSSRNVQLELM